MAPLHPKRNPRPLGAGAVAAAFLVAAGLAPEEAVQQARQRKTRGVDQPVNRWEINQCYGWYTSDTLW